MAVMPLIVLAAVLLLAHALAVAVYRLFYHPLSNFPGPQLAASSLWYEFYFDVIREGQWVWEIKRMHEKYGPIVRINPHELHIKDPDFYQDVYAPRGDARKRNKYEWWVNMAGAPGSIFATVDHDLHRNRRAPLEGFFSKDAVRDLEPLIRRKVIKLCDRLSKAARHPEVVRMDCAFMALTMDVISTYCFGTDRAYLDSDDFGLEWKKTINGAWEKGAAIRAFPFVPDLMRVFPRALAMKLDPNMGLFLAWQDSVKDIVQPILEVRDAKAEQQQEHRTIFHALRDSDLPPEERTLRRLCDEGEIFTGAGSETTAKTLTTILFYLTTDPVCLRKLKQELNEAIPDIEELPSWTELEQLPYLSAVIQEGLRLSYGVTTRLPRVVTESIQYKTWTIPSGTPVSQTPFFVLMDAEAFPEPETFKPERWIEDAKRLDKYQVVFGKGSRSCIGKNLAYAELYLTCAVIYRRFQFELYETGFKDIAMVHDFFVAAPAKPLRGVKVKVFAHT